MIDRVFIHALKEIFDRHPENAGKVPQPGSADPGGAALIFLYLLKSQPQHAGHPSLTVIQPFSAEQKTHTDMNVNRVGLSVGQPAARDFYGFDGFGGRFLGRFKHNSVS